MCRYQHNSTKINTILGDIKYLLGNKIIQGVFINHYRNGDDYAPYHKDKYGCLVASLSIGASRDFYFKDDETGDRYHYLLESGDMLLMEDKVNQKFKHSVPKRKGVMCGRICVTIFLK